MSLLAAFVIYQSGRNCLFVTKLQITDLSKYFSRLLHKRYIICNSQILSKVYVINVFIIYKIWERTFPKNESAVIKCFNYLASLTFFFFSYSFSYTFIRVKRNKKHQNSINIITRLIPSFFIAFHTPKIFNEERRRHRGQKN